MTKRQWLTTALLAILTLPASPARLVRPEVYYEDYRQVAAKEPLPENIAASLDRKNVPAKDDLGQMEVVFALKIFSESADDKKSVVATASRIIENNPGNTYFLVSCTRVAVRADQDAGLELARKYLQDAATPNAIKLDIATILAEIGVDDGIELLEKGILSRDVSERISAGKLFTAFLKQETKGRPFKLKNILERAKKSAADEAVLKSLDQLQKTYDDEQATREFKAALDVSMQSTLINAPGKP